MIGTGLADGFSIERVDDRKWRTRGAKAGQPVFADNAAAAPARFGCRSYALPGLTPFCPIPMARAVGYFPPRSALASFRMSASASPRMAAALE